MFYINKNCFIQFKTKVLTRFDEFKLFVHDPQEEENLVEKEEDLDVEHNAGLEIISDEIEESFKKFEVVVAQKLDGILAAFKILCGCSGSEDWCFSSWFQEILWSYINFFNYIFLVFHNVSVNLLYVVLVWYASLLTLIVLYESWYWQYCRVEVKFEMTLSIDSILNLHIFWNCLFVLIV